MRAENGAVTGQALLEGLPFVREIARAARGRPLYLVGGAVRDALLGRPTADFDLLVDDAPAVARRLGKLLAARVVVLHEDFPTVRVVAGKTGHRVTLDFASPRAPTLSADLRARDFAVNAIAAGPLGGRARLTDPCHGRADLEARVVRMTSAASLAADPVRVVRAYRFAAQLGFRIDRETRRACSRLAVSIAGCAGERIGAEVLGLLSGQAAGRALRAMATDGVLPEVVPELRTAVGVHQGGAHEFDVYTHSVRAAEQVSALLRQAPRLFPEDASLLRSYLADPETRAVLVLATILHDVGKPECRVWSGSRWRFFGHETRGGRIADQAGARLRLPRRVRQRVKRLVTSHMRLLPVMDGEKMTDRAKRRLVRDLGPDAIGLALLALADRRALRRHWDAPSEEPVLQGFRDLLQAAREAAGGRGATDSPITGDDLLRLGLRPGPRFRVILEAVEEEWIAGRLANREDALAWVQAHWRTSEPASGVRAHGREDSA